jgi:hypothetical protein
MSSLATNAITDASGGNTATINGLHPYRVKHGWQE